MPTKTDPTKQPPALVKAESGEASFSDSGGDDTIIVKGGGSGSESEVVATFIGSQDWTLEEDDQSTIVTIPKNSMWQIERDTNSGDYYAECGQVRLAKARVNEMKDGTGKDAPPRLLPKRADTWQIIINCEAAQS